MSDRDFVMSVYCTTILCINSAAACSGDCFVCPLPALGVVLYGLIHGAILGLMKSDCNAAAAAFLGEIDIEFTRL